MKIVAALSLLLFLTSCAGTVRNSYSFPELPQTNSRISPAQPIEGATLYVDIFSDDRGVKDIVIGDSGNAAPEGTGSKTVGKAIADAFAKRGVNISDSATLIISGAVKEWYTKLNSGLTGGMSAEAKIAVQLSDSTNQPLYTALYSGSAEYSGGFTKSEFQRVMIAAMEEAVAQVVGDQKLVTLLESE